MQAAGITSELLWTLCTFEVPADAKSDWTAVTNRPYSNWPSPPNDLRVHCGF